MITPELIAYIRQERLAGVTQEAVANALRTRGWTLREIDAASVAANGLPPAPIRDHGSLTGKALLSACFLAASAAYALSQQSSNTQIPTTADIQTQPLSQTPTPITVTPPPKKTGEFMDGSYTGSAADAYYGIIQVKAVIKDGALADVTFLQYPNDRSTSIYVSEQSMPVLRSEAIQAQSANVDIVSGATDTSLAFRESLGVALAKAQ